MILLVIVNTNHIRDASDCKYLLWNLYAMICLSQMIKHLDSFCTKKKAFRFFLKGIQMVGGVWYKYIAFCHQTQVSNLVDS